MLRFSLNQSQAADRIESAVKDVLASGLRTVDIYSAGTTKVGTREMGDAVVAAITKTTKGWSSPVRHALPGSTSRGLKIIF